MKFALSILIIILVSQTQAQDSFLPQSQSNYNYCPDLSGNSWVGTILEQIEDQSCLYNVIATVEGDKNWQLSITLDQFNGISNTNEKCQDKVVTLTGQCAKETPSLTLYVEDGGYVRSLQGIGFKNKIGIVYNDSEDQIRTSIGLLRGDQVFAQNWEKIQQNDNNDNDFCNDLNGSNWKGEFMWTSPGKTCLWDATGTIKTSKDSSQIEIDLHQNNGINGDGDDRYDPCDIQDTHMVGYCSGKNQITVRSPDWKYEGLGAGSKINLMQAEDGYPLWSVQFSLTKVQEGNEEVQQ